MDFDRLPFTWPTKIGAQGRILIPIEARKDIGWGEGTSLVICRNDKGLELMTRDQFVERVQHYFSGKLGEDRDLVNELIAERGEEAEREQRRH